MSKNNINQSSAFSVNSSVLSEGSSVLADKGPKVLTCTGKGQTKDTYDLLRQDPRLRNKLFLQLVKQRSAFKEARSYGSIDFSAFDVSTIVDLGGRILPEEKLNVVPITRMNWRETVRLCMSSPGGTMLLGSTGLGKTFKIPEFIREEYRTRVYLVLPNEDAAFVVWDAMRSSGRKVVLDTGSDRVRMYPDMVVVCTASVMLKRLVTLSEEQFGDCVIYMDEYHHASAAYDALRRLAGVLRSRVKLFAATATLNEKEQASRSGENVPRIHVQTMTHMSVVDLTKGSCPAECHPSNIDCGKWLYILPNHMSLINFYKRSKGLDKYYMSERLTADVNADSLRRFNSHKGSSPAVMLVTPEFGSMYNFDCDYVVDFGYTEDLSVQEACGLIRVPRYTTRCESRQRIGRLGRFGRAGTYFTWQDMSCSDHFSREDEVDVSVVRHYSNVYYSLFNFRPSAKSILRYSRMQALTLVDCTIVSALIASLVGKSGGVHRFLRGMTTSLFRRNVTVDDTLGENGFSTVHADIEKTSFVYHYEGLFPYVCVVEYSKLLVALLNPLASRSVLHAEPLATMDDYVDNSQSVAAEGPGNVNNQGQGSTGSQYSETARVQYPSSCDVSRAEVKSESSDSSVSTPVPSPRDSMRTAPERSKDTFAENKHEQRDECDRSSVLPRTLNISPDRLNAVPIGNIISETPQPHVKPDEMRTYYDYNREALAVIKKKIAVPDEMCVPFMTLYQETLGGRAVEEVTTKPETPVYTISRLRRESLVVGMMYTPLLSRIIGLDYYVANEDRKRKVIQWMDKPEKFFASNYTTSFKLDTFAAVWNWVTNDYLALMTKLRTPSGESRVVNRLWDYVTLRKSDEENYVEKSRFLRRMAIFYATVLRPKDLLLVPYKSFQASAMSYRDVHRWSAGVPSSLYPVCVWQDDGWKVVKDELLKYKCKILRVVDDGVGVGYAYMYSENAIYVAAHTVGVGFDPEEIVNVGGYYLSLSGNGKRLTLNDITGEQVEVRVDYASGQNEILRCTLSKNIGNGLCSCARIKPRAVYENEMVNILVPMYNPGTGVVDLYKSPVSYATFDISSGIGVCEVECMPGMSGAIVVSYVDGRPLGMVKAVNRGGNRNIMIFSLFPEMILSKFVYGAYVNYMKFHM